MIMDKCHLKVPCRRLWSGKITGSAGCWGRGGWCFFGHFVSHSRRCGQLATRSLLVPTTPIRKLYRALRRCRTATRKRPILAAQEVRGGGGGGVVVRPGLSRRPH